MDTHQYFELLDKIKAEVLQSRQRAAMAVNSRLIFTNWQIGNFILQEQSKKGWGAKVIEQLSKDLSQTFPEMKGFSKRNLIYMQKFAQEWQLKEFVQQAVAQNQNTDNQGNIIVQQPVAQFDLFEKHLIAKIPWSHHIQLLDKLDNSGARLFYCKKIIENNWSRKILLNQLDRKLHLQQGGLPNNF